MDKENNHISCVSVEVFQLSDEVDVECFDLSGELLAEVFQLSDEVDVECFNLSGEFLVECFSLGENVEPNTFLICSVNKDSFIRFKENMISWYGSDNKEGVIKYNTLITSGRWKLEDVEIEELL